MRRLVIRRRVAWAVIFILVALLAAVHVAFTRRLSPKNAANILNGMTQVEVEALLGGPPGFYRPPFTFRTVSLLVGTDGYQPPAWAHDRVERWFGAETTVFVYFDAGGGVTHVHSEPTNLHGEVIPLSTYLRYYLQVFVMNAPPY